MKRVSVGMLSLLAAALLAASASWAGDISPYANGPWLGFLFSAPGVPASSCSSVCALMGNAVAADDPPWIFTVGSGGATLEVVDAFITGDVFEVFDNNQTLGTTSAAPVGDSCGGDPDGCVGTSASYGLFQLAPGNHSITITAVVSPFNAGVAYFRIDGDVQTPPPPPPRTAMVTAFPIQSMHAQRQCSHRPSLSRGATARWQTSSSLTAAP